MKEYHTEIVIDAPREKVWGVLTDFDAYPEWNPLVEWLKGDLREGGAIEMFIKPLDRSFKATLKTFKDGTEFAWLGVQGAAWIVSGEHYYRLEDVDASTTKLLHGEYFRGIGTAFIGRSLLERMESTFNEHNRALKERVENA